MTNARAWTITFVAVVALAAAALAATGAGSFAQESSPTATPAASTPVPTEDAGDGGEEEGTPESDREGCPEKEEAEGTTTETQA
jgi:hypothetical protein